MSYLDHFLKESGSTTNTTHTTSSTIAINMVRITFLCAPSLWNTELLTFSWSFSYHHRIQYRNRFKGTYRINHRPVHLQIIFIISITSLKIKYMQTNKPRYVNGSENSSSNSSSNLNETLINLFQIDSTASTTKIGATATDSTAACQYESICDTANDFASIWLFDGKRGGRHRWKSRTQFVQFKEQFKWKFIGKWRGFLSNDIQWRVH